MVTDSFSLPKAWNLPLVCRLYFFANLQCPFFFYAYSRHNGVSFWWSIIMNLTLCFRIVLQWSHVPPPTTATATCLTVQSPTTAAQASLTTTGESTVNALMQLQTHRRHTSLFYPSTLINTDIDTSIGLICGCGYNLGNKQVSHREQFVGNLSTSANHPPERTQPAHTVHIQIDLYNYRC